MAMRILARLGGCLALMLCCGAVAQPPLEPEHLEATKLPPAGPHRVMVFDEALYNETDARLFVYDADQHNHLGQIDAGYYPGFAVSPDGKTTAVATTYWSRGWHGTRTDVVEFTDNSTLGFSHEVVLPSKRMQGPPTAFNIGYSSDQRFLYVANLTPAASITVLDLAKRAVVGEIETDGCVLVMPSGPRRVSSLCESGRLLTVVLGDDGHEASRRLSAPFFNVERDPVFAQGVPSGSQVLFVSFLGDLYSVDLSGAEPRFAAPWSLVGGAERGKWRPGGTQLAAYHRKHARLYVPMHRGGPGSHKVGGSEIWVYDTDSHKRLARWPVDTHRYGAVSAVLVSQDDQPLLFALTESAAMLIIDPTTGRVKHAEPKVGQTPWYLVSPL